MTAADTVRDFVVAVETELAGADLYFGHGTDNPLDEAAWLVGAALGVAPYDLDDHAEDKVSGAGAERIRALVRERVATRKPLAYLIREAWFAGEKYYVDERVIVPRSLIGEFVLERFEPWVDASRVQRALDLCTGSGCIAFALARAFPQARVDASDISADALAVARINAGPRGFGDRVRLVQSDLFGALGAERYDLIVTNPPYVAESEMRELPAEYRREPELALVSGADGLDAITRILREAPDHLTPDGALIAEVGNSCTALQEAFPNVPFLWLTTSTGDESVFLLKAAELERHREPLFHRGGRRG
jgi:ribosomal protein L3 glutamine methyltransferase